MRRADVFDVIEKSRVIAVVRMADPGPLPQVAEAVARGGVQALEITLTTPGALMILKRMAAEKSPGLLVGAGTVLDATAAETVIEAGADFVVSPILNFDLIRVCRAAGTFVAAGGLTPTEIVAAWNAGVDAVKVFPAAAVGPKYIRDLRGPFPDIRLMPTGGVDVSNAAEYIRNGAWAVAVGTALLDPRLIETQAWSALEDRARALVEALRRV